MVDEKYCISVNSKRRYIDPLVKTENGNKRIYIMSEIAREKINNYLAYQTRKYAYLDFEFG